VNTGGLVKVGSRTWLGVGSTIVNSVVVTDECLIGAGALVIRDITEPGTYVGVPANEL
jgi:acetyltransferase-like isoleucine patch superfamily enzyme